MLCLALTLAWSTTSLHEPAHTLLSLIQEYGLLTAAVSAVHALLLVSRHRRRLALGFKNSWLVAVPIDQRSVAASIRLRIAVVAMTHLVTIAVPVAAISWIAGEFALGLTVMMFVTVAFLVGSMVGWYLRIPDREVLEASRYAPQWHRKAVQVRPSDSALAHWPIALTLSWHRPENSRVALLVALFAVQGGSSIAIGLCVVVSWLVAIYLAMLLQATMQVGRTAASWLRATPIAFVTFAWPIARRAVLHQTFGALLAATGGVVLGLPLAIALYLVATWLAIVVCLTTVSLADSYCFRRSGIKLTLSVATFVGLEVRQHGWAIPCALVMAFWHLRQTTKFSRVVS
jgi:hypothetical protein